VILDIMAPPTSTATSTLSPRGWLVTIGMQGGVKAELNLGKLLGKRAG